MEPSRAVPGAAQRVGVALRWCARVGDTGHSSSGALGGAKPRAVGAGLPTAAPGLSHCPHPSPTFLAELGGDTWPQADPGMGSGWGSAHHLSLTRLLWPRRHHKKALRAVAFHRHYPLFASGSDDGTVIVCHGMVYK